MKIYFRYCISNPLTEGDKVRLILSFTRRNIEIVLDWLEHSPLFLLPNLVYWILHRILTYAEESEVRMASHLLVNQVKENPEEQARAFCAAMFDSRGVFSRSKLAAWNQRPIDRHTLTIVSEDLSTYLFLLPHDLTRIVIPPYLWPY